jgi:2-methylisocitrate lyase-like PEP mutase family enzyme
VDETQRERAARFHALNQGPGVLLLCNVWDAASACVVEAAGFPAVATTSAGIANSLGFPDGENAPFDEVVAAVGRIVRAVRVPVTADIEAGFGEAPDEIAESCLAVLEAGAVGVNLEDRSRDRAQLTDIAVQSDRIQAVKKAAARDGGALVVNARTDVFLGSIGAPDTRFDEAVRRCNAYRAAGADCLFVPGVTDEETIVRLVAAIEGPLNVLAVPGTPPVARLASLGVRRVSLGSGPMRATMGLLRRIAKELLESGTYAALTSDAISYDEANRFFTRG